MSFKVSKLQLLGSVGVQDSISVLCFFSVLIFLRQEVSLKAEAKDTANSNHKMETKFIVVLVVHHNRL